MTQAAVVAVLILFAALALALGAIAFQRAFIYFPRKEVVAPWLPGVSVERIQTPDGQSLIAWWRPPPQAKAPVFLFLDGNGGRPEVWEGRWRRIIDGGAGFLAVYYRGYSGSTGTPTEAGLHIDALAAYEWLAARGHGGDDIVIHGYSLGTGPAVRLAAQRPARAVILEAPYTGLDDIARWRLPFFPINAFTLRDQFRSREWIGKVRAPILIVHGDRDRVVPFAHGERLFALANEPKRFVRMEGSDHATLVRDGVYPHIFNFLNNT